MEQNCAVRQVAMVVSGESDVWKSKSTTMRIVIISRSLRLRSQAPASATTDPKYCEVQRSKRVVQHSSSVPRMFGPRFSYARFLS